VGSEETGPQVSKSVPIDGTGVDEALRAHMCVDKALGIDRTRLHECPYHFHVDPAFGQQ